MNSLENCINNILKNDLANNISVCVGKEENIIYEGYFSKSQAINELTKFDMASVTKIIATTTIALIAIDKELLNLNDKLSLFFNCPPDKSDITVQNLLTHTIGIGHKNLCNENFSYQNIEDLILNIPLDIPVGSNVLYSCPAYILLGRILEKVFGKGLDILFEELVAKPLKMNYTSYLQSGGKFVNSNLKTEEAGIVNDYNCKFYGGVAGNAGIFSNMHDMKKYADFLLNMGYPLISKETFKLALKNYTVNMDKSRGLGFMLVNDRYIQTGKLFKNGSIGHCGHTGAIYIYRFGKWAICNNSFGYDHYQ